MQALWFRLLVDVNVDSLRSGTTVQLPASENDTASSRQAHTPAHPH